MSLERFSGVAQADGADQVDQFAEALLVERRPGVVLGQHALEPRVVALDGDHRVVDELADGRLLGLGLADAPSGPPCGTQKTLSARYSSASSGSAPSPCSASSRCVLLLEGVGDVLEEDQAEDDVLVLGRVHVVAELVGRQPELRLEAEVGAVAVGLAGFLSRLCGSGLLGCHEKRPFTSGRAGGPPHRKAEDSSPPARFHPAALQSRPEPKGLAYHRGREGSTGTSGRDAIKCRSYFPAGMMRLNKSR